MPATHRTPGETFAGYSELEVGYGLSWWRCACGAARRVTGIWANSAGAMVRVDSLPCKRCGSTAEPHCVGDPWGGE